VWRIQEAPLLAHVDVRVERSAIVRPRTRGRTDRRGHRVRQVHGWSIMQDPAGLLFCVIPDRAERLTDDNAQRWD
jgi:hypothetical protein